MPNLVGKKRRRREQRIAFARPGAGALQTAFNSEQTINTVVRQTPPPGLLMKVSQQAHVVLSLGQRQLQIPSLEGNSLRVSRIELLRADCKSARFRLSRCPTSLPTPWCCRIRSRERRRLAARGCAGIARSREEAYVMPHLIGMNLADAVRRLDSVSIKRKLNSVSAPQWPHGAVIDQTPTPGARVASSFTVELTVAE